MRTHIIHGDFNLLDANSLRWRRLPDILESNPAVLVVDVDSVFNGPIEIGDEWDAGIFFRNEIFTWLKTLMAVSYFTDRAMALAVELRDEIEKSLASGKYKFMREQEILWKIHGRHKNLKIKRLGKELMTWDGTPAPIWTAKGSAKRSDWFAQRQAEFT